MFEPFFDQYLPSVTFNGGKPVYIPLHPPSHEIPKPTMKDTILFRLPTIIWNQTGGRFIGNKVQAPSLSESEKHNEGVDPILASTTAPNPNGEAKRRSKAKARQRT